MKILQQERQNRKMSRSELGQIIGISSESIRLLESGKRKPSYDVLVKLLDVFGYNDPRKLFKETD